MEAGHAAQNIYLQTTSLGLATVMVGAFDDQAVQQTLLMNSNEILSDPDAPNPRLLLK